MSKSLMTAVRSSTKRNNEIRSCTWAKRIYIWRLLSSCRAPLRPPHSLPPVRLTYSPSTRQPPPWKGGRPLGRCRKLYPPPPPPPTPPHTRPPPPPCVVWCCSCRMFVCDLFLFVQAIYPAAPQLEEGFRVNPRCGRSGASLYKYIYTHTHIYILIYRSNFWTKRSTLQV